METVDALELEISTRAGSAAETVEALAASVSSFGKNVRRYVNNMADFAGALERIADAAKSLSGIKGLGSVLSKISGSGMLEKAGAANVAAAKAAASKIGQDWKHAMFKNQKEYEQMFPSRAAFRGQTPEHIYKTGNDSSRVMDANDVVKSQASALAHTFQQAFGMDRWMRLGDMTQRIMEIRSGMGRMEGANTAWMTPKAMEGIQELAQLITMSAHSRIDGDAIEKAGNVLGSTIRLSETDMAELKSADMTLRGLNSILKDFGFSATHGSGKTGIESGAYADLLGLPSNASIIDVKNALVGAFEARNKAFIGEHGQGDAKAAEQWVAGELLRQILDVGARNEKVEMDPAMKALAESLEAQHKQNLETGAYKNVADDVKGSTQSITTDVKAAAEEVAADVKNAAAAVTTGTNAAKQAETGVAHFTHAKQFNPETGTWDPIKKGADEASALEKAKQEAKELEERAKAAKRQVKELMDALNKPTPKMDWSRSIDRMLGIGAEVKSAKDSFTPEMLAQLDAQAAEAAGNVQDVGAAAQDAAAGAGMLSGALQETTANNGALNETATRLERICAEAEAGTRSAGILSRTLGQVGKMISHSIIGQLIRVAKMRALRYFIREIAKGFSEGIQNVYHYSKGIGSAFAPAMDSAASALAKLKNSIGAAVSPLLTALIPAFNNVVSVVIKAINALNQFFALITGQSSWTMAVDQTKKAWEDTAKNTGSAAKNIKDAKDLLADWDELNIIQGEATDGTGGSGGGSKQQKTDYNKMFETVDTFNEKLKQFVDAMNEEFGSVWDLVKKVGAALLTWKFSSLFTGVIADIAGLMAIGLTVELAFKLTHAFADKFLETGEPAWLIADALTGAVGAVVAGKLATLVGGFGLAYAVVPLTLLFSATANVKANLEHTDVDALAPESVGTNIVSAMETGAAAGWLYYLGTDLSLAQSAGVAAGAGLLWFGIATGLKATVNSIDRDELTEETIRSDLVAALSTGGGLAIAEWSAGGTIGTIAGAGAGGSILTLSALIGIQAAAKAIRSEETEDTIKYTAMSSLSMGVGGAYLGKLILGGLAGTAAGGLLGAGITLAAVIGIRSAAKAVKAETNRQAVKDAAISSLSIGAAVAIVGGLIAGTAGTVIGFPVGALLTLGAIIAIRANIAADKHYMSWGKWSLAEEEVQGFVDRYLFPVDIKAKMEITAKYANITEQERTNITQMVEDLNVTVNSIRIGINDAESFSNLNTQINGKDGLVERFNAYTKARKKELEVAVSIVPIKTEDGTDESKGYVDLIGAGWDDMNTTMKTLGEQLADALSKGYNDKLDENTRRDALKTAATITREMAEIAGIVTASEAEVRIRREFSEGLEGIDQTSMDAILDYYKQKRDETQKFMEDEFSKGLDDLAVQEEYYGKMAEYAEQHGGSYLGKTKEYYLEMQKSTHDAWESMAALMNTSVEQALSYYTGPGAEMVKKALLNTIKGGKIDKPEYYMDPTRIWAAMFNNPENDPEKTPEKQFAKMLNLELKQAFGAKNAESLIQALNLGILKYSDLFSDDLFENLMENYGFTDPETVNAIADAYESVMGVKVPEELRKRFMTDPPEFETDPEIKTNPEVDAGEAKEAVQEAVDEAVDGVGTVTATNPVQVEVPTEAVVVSKKFGEPAGTADEEELHITELVEDAAGAAEEATAAAEEATSEAVVVSKKFGEPAGTAAEEELHIAELVEDAAGAAEEATGAAAEASETVNDQQAFDADEIAAIEKYWEAAAKVANGENDGLYEMVTAEKKLAEELEDKNGAFESIAEFIDNMLEGHDPGTYDPGEIPAWLIEDATQLMNSGTLGSAVDTAMGAATATLTPEMQRQNMTMAQLLAVMKQVQTNTQASANKKFEITITPGSLIGAFVNRSQGAFSAVSG